MAVPRNFLVLRFIYCVCFVHVLSSPVNISLQNVSDELLQSALNSFNEDSPTRHMYRGGNLISAQKLVEPPYVVYKLTLNLEPICEGESCPREACTIDLRQHELGTIDVQRESMQCMYLYPESTQEEVQEDTSQKAEDIIESLNIQSNSSKRVELDHEVQVTGNQSDRPFIAVRASSTGYCPGCPYELNTSLPGLRQFGEEAVAAIDSFNKNDYKYKLVGIVKVTRAVYPGANYVKYEILLEIGETNCLKSSLAERSDCSLRSNLPLKYCLVTFEERPWQQNSRKITQNNCTTTANTGNELNASIKPELTVEALTRVPTEESTSSELFDQIALEGNLNLYRGSDGNGTYVADEVTPQPVIEEQVIPQTTRGDQDPTTIASQSGFKNKYKEFDEFLEDFDIVSKTLAPKKAINMGPPVEEVFTKTLVTRPLVYNNEFESNGRWVTIGLQNIDSTEMTEASRTRDPAKLGAVRDMSDVRMLTTLGAIREESGSSTPKSANVTTALYRFEVSSKTRKKRALLGFPRAEIAIIRELAQRALSILDDIDPDARKRIILDILEATKETSDAVYYFITMSVSDTYCEEQTTTDAENCLKRVKGPAKICKVQIQTDEKKHVENMKVIQSECFEDDKEKVRAKRQLVGGLSPQDVKDPNIRRYAMKGLEKFSAMSDGTSEPIIVNITEATSQVVAGIQYKIKVKLGTSNCPKGVKQNCQLQAGSEIKDCLITVWSRPWLGEDEISVRCDAGSKRKRSLRGVNYSRKMLQQSLEIKQEKMFSEFMKQYGKTYDSAEERDKRFKIFQKNLKMIEELQRNEQATAIYGATIFADLTTQEFRSQYLGLRPELRSDNQIPVPMSEIPDVELPMEYDWRHYNVVTPVKDQGSCGSCWAFSVTGNVEGQYAIKHGKLLSLSEQELLDCDTLDEGCSGGLPDNAYRAIENLGGLELESDYPYEAENEKCHFDKSEAKVSIVSAVNITTNETQMAQWLVKNGPIATGINANAMQFYMGGISHPFKFLCNPDNLDHGVLIVGYGIHTYPLFKKTLPYWIIKNSWGTQWGEQGYYRVYRGDGTCGVNKMASSAVVA